MIVLIVVNILLPASLIVLTGSSPVATVLLIVCSQIFSVNLSIPPIGTAQA
jgi:hypothetical protein